MKYTGWITKDLPRKLVSLLLAIILWFLVVGVQNPEIDREFDNISVALQDNAGTLAQYGLSVISGKNQTVNVVVRGQRNWIASLSKSDIIAWVDIGGITKPGHYSLPIQVLLPDSSLKLISKQPSSISVWVDKVDTVQVPIEVEIKGTEPDGYALDSYTLNPTSVTISGPKIEIDNIAKAVVEINLDRITESGTQTLPYKLVDKQGDEVINSYIKKQTGDITVSIDMAKTKKLNLRVNVLNKPEDLAEDYYQISIDPSTLTVTGTPEALKSVGDIVLGDVDFNKIEQSGEYTFNINLPDGVKSVNQVDKAIVKVTLKDLLVKNISVPKSNISFTNVPPDVKPSCITQSVNVRLRGPSKIIQEIDASSISLSVDLKNELNRPGQYELPAAVTVKSSSSSSISIMGEYMVAVKIS